MKTSGRNCCLGFKTVLIAACFTAGVGRSQTGGVPEPGLILYGQIRNLATGGSFLNHGTLRWTITPPAGAAITVTVPLTNIAGQYSCVLRVPFESPVPGVPFSPSLNTLTLSNTSVTYTRSATVNFQTATIVSPSQPSFTFGAADRGRTERVDLTVSLPFVDSDNDGMDDNWELTYFGNLSRNGNGDADGDGVSDLNEYRAGTTPTDPASRFAIIDIRPDAAGGIGVQWLSVALRQYTVQRSSSPVQGFVNIQTAITATPGTNYFRDRTATGSGPYFYRLKIDNGDAPVQLAFRVLDLRKDPLGGLTLKWESDPGNTYTVQRSANLAQGFPNIIQTGIAATPGTNTFRDATATNLGPYYFRIKRD